MTQFENPNTDFMSLVRHNTPPHRRALLPNNIVNTNYN